MEFDGIRLVQIWNPFLQVGEDTKEQHDLLYQLGLWQGEKHDNVPVAVQRSAAITLLGTGSWYALTLLYDDAIANFSEAIIEVSDAMNSSDIPEFGSRPMTEDDGPGNEIFVAPIAPPFYDKLPAYRTGPEGIHRGEIEDMNKFLDNIAGAKRLPLLHAYPALSRGEPDVMVDITDTGFHVIDSVAEVKANILLNARCNAKLHLLHGSPYDGTCCTDYGRTTSVQSLIIFLGTAYILIGLGVHVCEMVGCKPDVAFYDKSAGMLVTALLACFVTDRTQVFAKGSKEFSADEFKILILLALVAGVVSMRGTRPQRSLLSAPVTVTDDVPLSRDQTDEWKGWMQAAILIYHWTGASKALPVYIIIRLMVAAYLFQAGYGHTVYFLTKQDFSLRRVAAVLLRLNMLSCALPYVMNTNYMLYYFAPLVSFWFAVIYITLAIGSNQNDTIRIVAAKIIVSAAIVAYLLSSTNLTTWIFFVLGRVFLIKWDVGEWQFRVSLDIFIVYVGMLSGAASVRTQSWNGLLARNWWPGLVGLVALAGYGFLVMALFTTKREYNQWHAYISFVPIISFLAMRNVTGWARGYHSKVFAWLGRCSLETFTLQFHLLLASDTKGILLLDNITGDGSLVGDRWRHLLIIVPLFLWISHKTAQATSELTNTLTSGHLEEYKAEMNSVLREIRPRWSDFKIWSAIQRLCASNNLKLRIAGALLLMWLANLVR